MPLQATSGAASYDAFGGGVAAEPNYIESCFSTYLYIGNGSTQTITNGIDLAGKGGLVWNQSRSNSYGGYIYDTARGTNKRLQPLSTSAQFTATQDVTAFNSNGFTMGTEVGINGGSGQTYASWTFRKQPKFFDVVTYTGDGTARDIPHNLGSVPGCIIIKCTSDAEGWFVYHRTQGNTKNGYLNYNSPFAVNYSPSVWNDTTPTSTVFTLGTRNEVNGTGKTFVAYLFAHDAGGFGLTGTDNVISCGSFTTDGSGNATVSLGYEPQWVLVKRVAGADDWYLIDIMRGWSQSGDVSLSPNLSAAEAAFTSGPAFVPTATGMVSSGAFRVNETYIYIAIRRGPMKVPTSGTSVFGITTAAGTSPAYVSSFPVDVALRYQITGGDPTLQSRLTGPKKMFTDYDFAEGSNDANLTWDYQNGMFTTVGANANQYGWLMRRAPSFMDVVCYTGTGSATTQAHNLGVVPELMIVKRRSSPEDWYVYSAFLGNTKYIFLDVASPEQTDSRLWNNTTPTSSVFSIGTYGGVNSSGGTFVAYLFATCAGVSKVGSYTGNGSTQTINCGFTGGARFVIIKRTDSTGGWYVYDTDRGMTTLTDPYFFLNDAAAQVATLGSVTTVTTGFALNSTILSAINVSGGSYIFLAIA